MARSTGRKAMDAHRAKLPAYAVPNPWVASFHEKHRCDACGCRQEQHSQGGFCPRTLGYGSPAPFPSMDLDDAAFNAAALAYFTEQGTTWRPR